MRPPRSSSVSIIGVGAVPGEWTLGTARVSLHERGTELRRHRGAHGLDDRAARLELAREREQVLVVDAADVRVAEAGLVHLVHQVLRLGDELVAQIGHEVRELRRLDAGGERLASREEVETRLERVTHRLAGVLGADALELRLVDRAEALDEHLRLLRDRAVAVAPLVDAREHRHRLAHSDRELLGALDPETLDELALRHAQEAVEVDAVRELLRMLVGVLDLRSHEDADADELVDERREEVRRGRHGRNPSSRCRSPALRGISHQIDGRITSSSDLVRRGIHLGYVVFAM